MVPLTTVTRLKRERELKTTKERRSSPPHGSRREIVKSGESIMVGKMTSWKRKTQRQQTKCATAMIHSAVARFFFVGVIV